MKPGPGSTSGSTYRFTLSGHDQKNLAASAEETPSAKIYIQTQKKESANLLILWLLQESDFQLRKNIICKDQNISSSGNIRNSSAPESTQILPNERLLSDTLVKDQGRLKGSIAISSLGLSMKDTRLDSLRSLDFQARGSETLPGRSQPVPSETGFFIFRCHYSPSSGLCTL